MSHILEYMFPIIRTQIEMVRDRGYDISEEESEILDMDSERFSEIYADHSSDIHKYFTKFYYSDSKNPVYVAYEDPLSIDKTGIDVNKVRNLFNFLDQTHKSDVIYITGQKLNSAATKEFMKYSLGKNHFTYDLLRYNITKHYSNSKYQILSRSEIGDFLRANRITDIKKIPYMVDTDPVALYYGLVPGNVVRITRHTYFYDSMLNESISYRLVVRNPKVDIEKTQHSKSSDSENKIEKE